jgi:hypothetical protein
MYGEAFPNLKEVLLPLILGQHTLKMWVFVATIVLWLNILCAYNGSVDLGRQLLRLEEKEISLCSPGAGPWPSSLLVVKDQVMPAQCKRLIMARLESSFGVDSPLGVENGLIEAGLCARRTLRSQEPDSRPSGSTREDP